MAHYHIMWVKPDEYGNAIGEFPRLSRAAKYVLLDRVTGGDSRYRGYHLEYRDDPNGQTYVRVVSIPEHGQPAGEWEPVNELPEDALHQQFNLGDATDRGVLADLLEDEGRDSEANLLRNPPPVRKRTAGARWVPLRWEGGRIVPNLPPEGYEDVPDFPVTH